MDYKFETRCIHRDNEHEEGHPRFCMHTDLPDSNFLSSRYWTDNGL